MRKRSGPTRRCWPTTHWKSVIGSMRGRGYRSRPLLAQSKTTTTTGRGWSSVWALSPRSGFGPHRPRRAPLAAWPHPRMGQQHPCPGHRRQPSLHPSLPRWKRRGLWRWKSPYLPQEVIGRLWVHRSGPLSDHPLQGIRRRGPSTPPCSRSEARSGPDHRYALGPCPEAHRREGYRPVTNVGGGASGTEEPEAEACCRAPLRVSCRCTKMSYARSFFFLTVVLFSAPSAELVRHPSQPPRR